MFGEVDVAYKRLSHNAVVCFTIRWLLTRQCNVMLLVLVTYSQRKPSDCSLQLLTVSGVQPRNRRPELNDDKHDCVTLVQNTTSINKSY